MRYTKAIINLILGTSIVLLVTSLLTTKGDIMIQWGLCPANDYTCARLTAIKVIAVLIVIGVILDVVIPRRKKWAEKLRSFLKVPKRTNLKLICNPIKRDEITLKVCNREWRYRSESILAGIEYLEKLEPTDDHLIPHSGTLRWLSDLSSVRKGIGRWHCASVEFVKLDSSARKFHVSYHYANSERVESLEFGVGQHQFTVHIVGDALGRYRSLKYRVESHYDVMVSYTGDGSISAEIKNANSSYADPLRHSGN